MSPVIFPSSVRTHLKSINPTDSFGSFIEIGGIGGSRGSTVVSDELIDEFVFGA